MSIDEDGACCACGTPLQLCGHRPDTAKALREGADRIQTMAPGWARRMREEAEKAVDDVADPFAYDCPLCWDTGEITLMQMDRDGNSYPVPRPCPEGCLAPGEVPFR